MPNGRELVSFWVGNEATSGRAEWFHSSTSQEAGGAEHLPTHNFGQRLDTVNLMLGDLAQDEITQLLWLVAEVEHSSVLADDPEHLLSDVNHQLCLDDGVVTSAHYTHLRREKR